VIAYNYINNQKALEDYCRRLGECNVLAVDTEFVRERTFFPLPGLIQVSDGDVISLIDPLDCANMQPFFDLLESEDICIIMHSSSEDIELFYHMGCGVIKNLFDTQIAATWLGMGQSLSLQKLVENYHDITIEKQLSRTDWLKRPLSEAQLQYAAADVLYLTDIYQQQYKKLATKNFLDKFIQDCDLQCEKQSVEINNELAYLKVKKAVTVTGGALTRLKEVAKWREVQARNDNKPRQHVLKDQQVVTVCQQAPRTVKQLVSKCDLPPFIARRYGKQLVQLVNDYSGKAIVTKPAISLRSLHNGGKTLNECREFLSLLHEQTSIPREVLPSKRWLEQFLLHYAADWYPKPYGWKGWRKTLLEKTISQIISKNEFGKTSTG